MSMNTLTMPSTKDKKELIPVDDELEELLLSEQSRLEDTTKKYRLTPKYKRWTEFFLDKEDKLGFKTFGNATQSAIHAYDLDPDEQYFSAKQIGHENYTKLNHVGSALLERIGITHASMLATAVSKMQKTDRKEWYDEVAYHLGMPIKEKNEVNKGGNTQINFISVTDPRVKDFNALFKNFIRDQIIDVEE